MIRISGFDIVVTEIPLRGITDDRNPVTHNLLVAAHDAAGYTGWGEACPRPGVTGETLEQARDTLLPDIILRKRFKPFIGDDNSRRKLEIFDFSFGQAASHSP